VTDGSNGDLYNTPLLARRSPSEIDTYPLTVRRRSTRAYGWIPDHPDHRDRVYVAKAAAKRPASVDLDPCGETVYDQGPLGSCSANAIAAAIQFARLRSKARLFDVIPSRLFIYFGQRVIAGTIPCDCGGSLRDGLKVAANDGVCLEGGKRAWPYDIRRFADSPPSTCFSEALKIRIGRYLRVRQVIGDLEACLAEGLPFLFGFVAFARLEDAPFPKNGVLLEPRSTAQPIGNHAVMAVGYDRADKTFRIRNSWGTDWALNGFFKMPYDYIADPRLAGDFWTIRSVTGT
jgi:C1A family cysteine protease